MKIYLNTRNITYSYAVNIKELEIRKYNVSEIQMSNVIGGKQ